MMNIKLLPAHYILKRWTREARSGSVEDSHGRTIVENPKLEALHLYSFLSHKFSNLATQASNCEECCRLIESALDSVCDEWLNGCAYTSDERHNGSETTQVPNDILNAARLKKKQTI
jgi:zinc finger SWIM domain-containing protein 3